jgi:hypothetical protein
MPTHEEPSSCVVYAFRYRNPRTKKWHRARYIATPILFALCCASAHALDLDCVEEPGTLRNFCYAPSKVLANGDLRSSPLFMGGPKDVDSTTLTIVVNCKTKAMTLQNRQGVNVQAGAGSDTRLAEYLVTGMCRAKSRSDKSLRQ